MLKLTTVATQPSLFFRLVFQLSRLVTNGTVTGPPGQPCWWIPRPPRTWQTPGKPARTGLCPQGNALRQDSRENDPPGVGVTSLLAGVRERNSCEVVPGRADRVEQAMKQAAVHGPA